MRYLRNLLNIIATKDDTSTRLSAYFYMAFENYYAIRARLSLQESLGKYNHCIAIRIKIQTRWLDSTILWSTIWFNIMLTKKNIHRYEKKN